jgi:outer membrane protein assembly factor BamB
MNQYDVDLGSIGPAIVGTSNDLVFQTGKSGWGYVVSTRLSGAAAVHVGSEPFSGKVCNAATTAMAGHDQVYGGLAYRDPYIYVPCPEGIKALQLAAGPSFSTAWSSPSFHPGPPIVAGGIVWAMDTNNGSLFGLNPTTGVTVFHLANLGQMTHFTTPTAGRGRIYVPFGNQVRAFDQPRAQRGVPIPPSSSVNRSGAAPPVPQSAAGGRPLVPLPNLSPGDPFYETIPSTRGLLRQLFADLIRLF